MFIWQCRHKTMFLQQSENPLKQLLASWIQSMLGFRDILQIAWKKQTTGFGRRFWIKHFWCQFYIFLQKVGSVALKVTLAGDTSLYDCNSQYVPPRKFKIDENIFRMAILLFTKKFWANSGHNSGDIRRFCFFNKNTVIQIHGWKYHLKDLKTT